MTITLTQDVKRIALTLMEGLNTPRALTVAILSRYEEWGELANLRVSPRSYLDADSLWRDSMATDFFRKCRDLSEGDQLSTVTFNKWLWAEHLCKRTNDSLRELDWPRNLLTRQEVALSDLLSEMRKIIEGVIGNRPPQNLPGRFGPGATVSDPSSLASIPDKMSSVPTYTPSAWLELVPWSGTAWASACAALGRSPQRTRGNVYFEVPKDATTNRACAKEPSINGFYQLGVGSFLKDCLLRAGIDLYSGQETHQRAARKGSIDDSNCTIDLTSASDTLSRELVARVLPRRWFEYLDGLRSHCTKVNGSWYVLEKFSSMGNGFTFELETLVFYALAKALRPGLSAGTDLLVYGDDIIIPKDLGSKMTIALKLLGFVPNEKKTFYEGPFRESCGGDFFNGVPVTGARMEELPNEPQHYISLANSLRRVCHEEDPSLGPHRLAAIRRAWFACLDCLPKQIRGLRGPKALGDQVIHDDYERWTIRWRNSRRYIRAYRPRITHVVRWDGFAYDVQFAAALYGVPTNLPTRIGGHYPAKILVGSRLSTVGYKVGWALHS